MAKIGTDKNKKIPTSQIIQINPYEAPERTLQMITRISMASSHVDTTVVLSGFSEKLLSDKYPKDNILEFLKSVDSDLSEKYFWINLKSCLQDLRIQLETKENTEHTQIVVAGGFASGKSTFLNTILGESDLLPTAISPTSVVPTYLYCSKKTKDLQVKGVNFKNAVVELDRDVLMCIQHSSKSNVYLSPLLKKLIIEIHSDMHDGIAYIDTPGYNNYEKIVDNGENTDRQTSINVLKSGNVLFWVHDIEIGAITKEDKHVIEQFKGKLVIIFNKADTKPIDDIRDIVKNAQKEFNAKSKSSNVIDIIAYSSYDNRIYYSMKGYDMPQLLKKVKSSGTGQCEIKRIQKQIELLFDTELDIQRTELIRLKEIWEQNNIQKDKVHRYYIQNKDSNTDLLDTLTEVGIGEDDYERVQNKLEELNQRYKTEYEVYNQHCTDIAIKRKRIKDITKELVRFKGLVSVTIRRGIKLYNEMVDADKIPKTTSRMNLDVFTAIRTRNMNAFLDCFAAGLDIVKTLSDSGYNPLTYAVKYGENDMVKFLIDQGADLRVYDERGYNAFLTAVENNYKDLCQIILDIDYSLLKTKTKSGESAIDIARRHNFETWLSNKKN